MVCYLVFFHLPACTSLRMIRIPPLIRFLFVIAAFYLVALSLLRIGFLLAFHNSGDPLSLAALLQSFYLGLKFDLRLTLIILAPLLITALGTRTTLMKALRVWGIYLLVVLAILFIYFVQKGFPGFDYLLSHSQRIVPVLIIPPVISLAAWLNPMHSLFWRRFWAGYLILAAVGVMFAYIIDFGHYAYLGSRIDATVIRFLDNPLISGQMVWESYPVIWITLGFILFTLFYSLGIWLLLERCRQFEYRTLPQKGRVALLTAVACATLFGIYGKFSFYPLRWSDAFFGTHAFAASTALNPVLYFADTYMNGGTPFDREAVERSYDLVARYLGADPHDANILNFTRPVTGSGPLTGRPNVVVVILESFAAYKSGLSGNPLDTTPNIDAIARSGVYFTNFFTPHTGTARSVFAFTTGIPDVQLGDTSSRNPTIVNQHMLANDFTGYEKFYFLGGSASWRNIRGLLSRNIAGLHIYEEGSYEAPIVDVWGVSDLDLFKEADQVLRQQTTPFFAVIQTAGNHRPYTIPEDNEGFTINTPDLDVTRHGFESVQEYNSYRFMDHSIGHFMHLAQEAGYFDNTLFVFFGDHGISYYAGDHAPRHETQLQLGNFRVPFILYAPKLLNEASVEHKIASEVDVMTTLANLTGHAHINTTFGRDLFDPRYDQDRYAFVITHGNSNIGLIGQEYFFRMRIDGGDKRLFALNTETPRADQLESQPQLAAEMEALTRGLYEASRYIMNHNAPRQARKDEPKNQVMQ